MKKLLSFALSLSLAINCLPGFSLAEEAPVQIDQKTVAAKLYFPGLSSTDDLYFVHGQEEIAYLNIFQMEQTCLASLTDIDAQFTMVTEDNLVTVTRENGAKFVLDFDANTFYWDDLNLFFAKSFSLDQPLDMVSTKPVSEEERKGDVPEMMSVRYLYERTDTIYRKGNPVTIHLDDYDIHLIRQGDLYLVPAATLSDVLMVFKGLLLNYSSRGLYTFLRSSAMFTDFRSDESTPRSQDLANFTYNEMCLALDLHYGLKKVHHIESFDTLFRNLGIDKELRSTDAAVACAAFTDFIKTVIDDQHSALVGVPTMTTLEEVKKHTKQESLSAKNRVALTARLQAAEAPFAEISKLPYYEVGNTAFIRFDSFDMDFEFDYYRNELTYEAASTTGTGVLVAYAHQQITRENSPIENVVVDLSQNSGGAFDAAVFTLGWMLGDVRVCMEDQITGAASTITYRADVNHDNHFDARDTIEDKNVYLLTTALSFSCGNFVPAVCKADGRVKILGARSGGGGCSVDFLMLADGTEFSLSSRNSLSTFSNGVYYSVDQGVEPDIALVNESSYYDRTALAEYINSLK